tara:strand:- start:2529 stop:2789 length:261 start_codon:yes stop_codon:yes gene_type:complete
MKEIIEERISFYERLIRESEEKSFRDIFEKIRPIAHTCIVEELKMILKRIENGKANRVYPEITQSADTRQDNTCSVYHNYPWDLSD